MCAPYLGFDLRHTFLRPTLFLSFGRSRLPGNLSSQLKTLLFDPFAVLRADEKHPAIPVTRPRLPDSFIMPAIRHASKRKPPPEGFADIEDDLLIFSNKMKDAQNKPPPAGPKHQAQWEVFQIAHQRSRYVYDLYYEKEAISKQLYEWLLKNGYADALLIAKWKKQGYEKVIFILSCHHVINQRANPVSALLPAMHPNK